MNFAFVINDEKKVFKSSEFELNRQKCKFL